MAKTVDYYFTTVSPFSYLGHQQFAQIVAKHGARVNVKPMDLGKIFPVSGGIPLKQRAAQRQAYRLVELERFDEALVYFERALAINPNLEGIIKLKQAVEKRTHRPLV